MIRDIDDERRGLRTVLDLGSPAAPIDVPPSVPAAGGLGPGDALDGLAILEVIGAGAMGTVYRAYDPALERDVAVKVIHAKLLDRDVVREAFAAEAKAMARVRHANVVTIHSLGEHREQPYLVMEYVRGTSLATWHEDRQAPSLRDALLILDPLCRGVAAIHDSGTVHRDIKPGNVLVESTGRVAVTDFGLARAADPVWGTAEKFTLGTPAYIAPEVAREEPIEPRLAARADVYALAVVAFELLTGQRPFGARSMAGMLQDHAFTPPPRPSELNPALPKAFDEVLLRALAKSPAARTPSAQALRRELSQAYDSVLEFPRGLRILTADDDTGALLAVRELLLDAFPAAEVISVTNTNTAAAMALRDPPDIVITDLHMPDGGATKLTAILREHPATARVPIIVVTGQGGADDWRELRALGADRFLVKPLDFDALAAMIRASLRHAAG